MNTPGEEAGEDADVDAPCASDASPHSSPTTACIVPSANNMHMVAYEAIVVKLLFVILFPLACN
jgi:hypothetical protein